jgi:hypothetical protein
MKNKLFQTGILGVLLVFGFTFIGCGGGGDDGGGGRSGRLVGGKKNAGTSGITNRSATDAIADECPFILDITGGSSPVYTLGGKIAFEKEGADVKIDLKGVFDERTGIFIAGGVSDADEVGFQIEGNTKNDEITVTFKVKEAGEWKEFTYTPNVDKNAQVDVNDSVDIGESLDSSWTGRYVSEDDRRNTIAIPLNINLGGPIEYNDNSIGARLAKHFYVFITPQAFSIVADYNAMEADIDYIVDHKSEFVGTEWEAQLTKEFIKQKVEEVAEGRYLSFLQATSDGDGYKVLAHLPQTDGEDLWYTVLRFTRTGNGLEIKTQDSSESMPDLDSATPTNNFMSDLVKG